MNRKLKLFGGSSHQTLTDKVCKALNIARGKIDLTQFPDGEIHVQILEDVRGCDVFIVQSIVNQPNHYLMELLIIIDALKRASAKSITAVIPYFGYCRQDRRNVPGVPITAKLVANLLTCAGIDQLITCDLHADQMEGFFEIPVQHLHADKILCDAARPLIEKECILVAPDIGSVKIAERMAKIMQAPLAVIKKERKNSHDVSMTLIGIVKGKSVLIVDDLCSTAGTLAAAANLCKKEGAIKVIGAVTHGLFVEDAIDKIERSILERLIVTDTIPQGFASTQIDEISIAPLIAHCIKGCNL